jgi:hypothetical protein
VAGGGHTDAPGIRIPDPVRMKRCGVTSTETMIKSSTPVADGLRDRGHEALVRLLAVPVEV